MRAGVSNFIHEYESPFRFGTRESSPASFLVFSPPLRVPGFSISGADVMTTVYEDYMVPALPVLDTFRTFFRSPPLDFRLHYQAFQDGASTA